MTTLPAAPVAPLAEPRLAEWLLLALFATLLYLHAFGSATLDPRNTAWLLSGDPAQHYLGWYFFRNEAWQWPLGHIAGFGLPEGSSIALTDAIPLLALLFKPFSPWLPENFQYFGLWMLACFILNGIFGLQLLARLTADRLLRLFGAAFFILSPPLLFRGHGHESLMAQWLILAGLKTCLDGWRWQSWGVWGSLAALIHPYLLLMVLGLMSASALQAGWVLRSHARLQLLREGFALVALLLLLLWQAGYLGGASGGMAGSGYGYYSMNALTWFDPIWGASRFLKPHDFHPDFLPYGQYEGLAYLGAGMLILAAMALAVCLVIPNLPLKPLLRRHWPLLGVTLLLWLLALSNKIMVGKYHLVTLPLPATLHQALAVFRASGRLGWPLFYLLYLGVLACLIRYLPAPRARWLLAAALLLQVADQTQKYQELRGLMEHRRQWTTPLVSPQWETLAAGAKRLILIPPHPPMEDLYIPFAHLAARHRLATNAAHLARVSAQAAEAHGQQQAARLAQGRREPDTLYVFPSAAGLSILPPQWQAELLHLDGYAVLPALPRP